MNLIKSGNMGSAAAGAFLLMVLIPNFAFAHKGHTHLKPEAEVTPEKKEKPEEVNVYEKINASYRNDVESILRKACFDCHSAKTRYPWYATLPFARSFIDGDIAEAKKHLDMSQGFPFKGHGSIEEDLDAIEEVIRDGTMPPFRYWVLHSKSHLTDSEKDKIQHWAEDSLSRLKK